jgi:hypothetical protein
MSVILSVIALEPAASGSQSLTMAANHVAAEVPLARRWRSVEEIGQRTKS